MQSGQDAKVGTPTEIRNGMRITWHQPIAMDDGLVLRADVCRPIADGRYPMILIDGVYAKGLSYQGYPGSVDKDGRRPSGSSTNKYSETGRLENFLQKADAYAEIARQQRSIDQRIQGAG